MFIAALFTVAMIKKQPLNYHWHCFAKKFTKFSTVQNIMSLIVMLLQMFVGKFHMDMCFHFIPRSGIDGSYENPCLTFWGTVRFFWHFSFYLCKQVVWTMGLEDPLEKKMAIHCGILPWRIPWTEKPGRLQSMGLQRGRHDWATQYQLN